MPPLLYRLSSFSTYSTTLTSSPNLSQHYKLFYTPPNLTSHFFLSPLFPTPHPMDQHAPHYSPSTPDFYTPPNPLSQLFLSSPPSPELSFHPPIFPNVHPKPSSAHHAFPRSSRLSSLIQTAFLSPFLQFRFQEALCSPQSRAHAVPGSL